MPAWEPPSHYDVLRELNAQAGRLATVVGLLVAAVSFGVGTEPYRAALSPNWAPGQWDANALALSQVVDLACCVIGVLWAVLEALPGELDSEDAWRRHIARRQGQLAYSKIALVFTVVALVLDAELTVQGAVNTSTVAVNACLTLILLVLGIGPSPYTPIQWVHEVGQWGFMVGRYARAWVHRHLPPPSRPSGVP